MSRLRDRLKIALLYICRDSVYKINGVKCAIWPVDVATAAGLTVKELNSIIHEHKPVDDAKLDRIADALGVCKQWLRTGNTKGSLIKFSSSLRLAVMDRMFPVHQAVRNS